MTNRSPIECIAFISSNSNKLIKFYVTSNTEETMTYQFALYASIDEIDRRISDKMSSRSKGQNMDSALGHLCNLGPLSIFGYITKTRHKILIGVKQTVAPQKDLSKIFVELHQSYISHVIRNPFVKETHDNRDQFSISAQDAPKFDTDIGHILGRYNESS